jgi:hypothetical protein
VVVFMVVLRSGHAVLGCRARLLRQVAAPAGMFAVASVGAGEPGGGAVIREPPLQKSTATQ